MYTHTSDGEEKKGVEAMAGRVVRQLIQNGKYKHFDHLIYPFPKGSSPKVYLGGAHGIAGVLFMILSAFRLMPGREEVWLSAKDIALLKQSLDFCLSV